MSAGLNSGCVGTGVGGRLPMPMWFLQPSHQMLYGISNLHKQKTAYLPLSTGLFLRLHTLNCSHSCTAKSAHTGRIQNVGELFPRPALSQPTALQLADPFLGESPWALPCLPCLTIAAKQPGTEEEAGCREHCYLFELGCIYRHWIFFHSSIHNM